MNEEKSLKVLFIQADEKGNKFGSGNWTENQIVYVKNFRRKDARIIADISRKTDETYVNKMGEVRNVHKICGILSLTPQEATVIVDLDGGKDTLTCIPKTVQSSKNGKEYIILNFNGDGIEPNPYEAELSDGWSNVESAAKEIGL